MSEDVSQPCEEWAEQLALVAVDGFPIDDDYKKLASHVHSCAACRAAYENYTVLRNYMHNDFEAEMLVPDPPNFIGDAQQEKGKSTLKRIYGCLKQSFSTLNAHKWLICIPLLVGILTLLLGWRIFHSPLAGMNEALAFGVTLAPAVLVDVLVLVIMYRYRDTVRLHPTRSAYMGSMRRFFAHYFSCFRNEKMARVEYESPITSFARSVVLEKRHARRNVWMLVVLNLSLLAALTFALAIPFANMHSSAQVVPPVYLSTGGSAFDVNRPDGALKTQAAHEVSSGNIGNAEDLLRQAIALDSSDGEALIYSEDLRVLSSHQPYVTVVVSAMLYQEFIGGGRDMLQGAYLVQHDWNAHHALKILVMIADCNSDQTTASAVAKQIVQRAKVDHTIIGVVGWETSSSAQVAIGPQTAQHLPLISPTVSSNAFTNISPYFFRVAGTDAQQGYVGAMYASQVMHARHVLVFTDPHDAYSSSLAQAFSLNFQQSGGNIYTVTYAQGDVKSLATSTRTMLMKHPDIDLIYFAGYVSDASVVLRSLSDVHADASLKMMGGDALYVQGDYSLDAFSNYERLRFTSFAFPDQHSSFAQLYARTFDPGNQYQPFSYGRNFPDADAILSDEAMTAVTNSLQQLLAAEVKQITPELLTQQLRKAQVSLAAMGESGSLAFNAQGNVVGGNIFVLSGAHNGTTSVLKQYDYAQLQRDMR